MKDLGPVPQGSARLNAKANTETKSWGLGRPTELGIRDRDCRPPTTHDGIGQSSCIGGGS
eukprot:9500757-Pyramimonas_sp.AAC.1